MATKVYAKNRKASTIPFQASWPALTEQSTFEGDETGRYEVKMVLSKDSEEYKRMQALVAEAHRDGIEAFGEDWECTFTPFKEFKEKDEDGEYQVVKGKVSVVFRAGAKRKDKATGKKKVVQLNILDKYGDPWDQSVKITGGSNIQLSYETNPYDMKMGPNVTQGVQFRMKAVKIIQLVDGFGGGSEDLEFEKRPEPAPFEGDSTPTPVDEDDIPF